jgi:hypothetical protein
MLSSLRLQTDFTRLSVRLMKARLRVPITSDTTTPRDDSRPRYRQVRVEVAEIPVFSMGTNGENP